jgi:hypothetical protein
MTATVVQIELAISCQGTKLNTVTGVNVLLAFRQVPVSAAHTHTAQQ